MMSNDSTKERNLSDSQQDDAARSGRNDELTLTCSACGQAFRILASQKSDIVECPHCQSQVNAAVLISDTKIADTKIADTENSDTNSVAGACPQCEAETSIVIPAEIADQRKLLVTCDTCGKEASIDAFIKKRQKLDETARRKELEQAERERQAYRRAEQEKRRAEEMKAYRVAEQARMREEQQSRSQNRITQPTDQELRSLIGILRTLATITAILSGIFFVISFFGIVFFPLVACFGIAILFAAYWFTLTIGAKVLSLLGSIAQGIERIDRKLDSSSINESDPK